LLLLGDIVVSFEEFEKIDLRVGKIESVEDIEGKDRLYKLTVDFKEEKRTVVAGLKEYFEKSDLEGKKAAFVYNLDPVTLAGIESQAMIMAAKNNEGQYKVFFADESVEEGTKLE
jgi:methionyl-tRNA synthetase